MKNLILACLLCSLMVACGEQEAAQDVVSDNTTMGIVETEDLTSEALKMSNVASTQLAGENPGGRFGRSTGDLDQLEERRLVRVLTVYGLGRYWLDGPEEKGLTYELFKMYESFLNDKLGKKHLRVHVVFIPVSRDELIPALLDGRGDIAAAGLTITAEREQLIDFTDPASKEISEILVSGPSAPEINDINDLSGRKILVRRSSSYRTSLDELNQRFKQEGKAEIELQDANEVLEDEDLLEMVNAGLLDWVVVDNYKANNWSQVFDKLVVRNDIVFRKGGKIGFAVREDNPQLKQSLNEFLKTHRQGTLSGNILVNRNFRDYDWSRNALEDTDYQQFQSLVDIFKTYGQQYGVDYLMVAAQGYQESRLDQSARSGAGAIGVMQLLPSTASDSNVDIHDISTVENNIHAGVKYLSFIRERYFSGPEMNQFNKNMFSFAAYNAGPARVRGLRAKAEAAGLDPNIWFDNVEIIAAKEIGRETVQYVANILKYYVAYSLSMEQQIKRETAREEMGSE